jgi:uncharacterized lipoprotein YajG
MSMGVRRRLPGAAALARAALGTVAALLALALLPGCALVPETIVLSPAPMAGAQPLPEARGLLVRVTVRDQRARTDRVSAKVNSHGHELAPIQASQDVAVTLQQALEGELQARGFAPAPGAAATRVAVGLKHLFSDFRVGYFSGDAVAQVQLAVVVQAGDGPPRFARVIGAEGVEPGLPRFDGANAARALNKALEAAMQQLFDDPDFNAALLGRGSGPL